MKTPSSSRIIGAESLSGVRRFTLSDLAGQPPEQPAAAAAEAPADPVFEAGRQQGLREGMLKGIEAAREHAARDAARRDEQAVSDLATRAARLSAALEEQFALITRETADELVDLAIEIARRTVGQALEVDRAAITTVAQEAIAALLDERSSFMLHVNPNDKPLLDHALGDALTSRGARTVADPAISPGGCRVVSSSAEVDARIETRWRRVIAAMGRLAPALHDPEVR